MDIWEEIEVKVNSENNIPPVKTSNKVGGSKKMSGRHVCQAVLCSELLCTSEFQEITSILKELMRVQRQLEGKS